MRGTLVSLILFLTCLAGCFHLLMNFHVSIIFIQEIAGITLSHRNARKGISIENKGLIKNRELLTSKRVESKKKRILKRGKSKSNGKRKGKWGIKSKWTQGKNNRRQQRKINENAADIRRLYQKVHDTQTDTRSEVDKFKENVDYLKKGFVSMNIMLIQNMKKINALNQTILEAKDAVEDIKDTLYKKNDDFYYMSYDVESLSSKMNRMMIALNEMKEEIKNLERKTSTGLLDHCSCYS